MRFDYYVFDFDGTVAETGEGIRKRLRIFLKAIPDNACRAFRKGKERSA